MPAQPKLERFCDLAKTYELVPVYRRLLSDTLTPVSAFQLVDDGNSAACLFESVIGGEKVGRYSFIAVSPRGRILARGDEVQFVGVDDDMMQDVDKSAEASSADPLESLWQVVSGKKVAVLPELPPLTGGAIGYASYDVVRYVEDLPNVPKDDRQLPDMDFSLFDDLIIFDHVTKSLFVVAHVHLDRFENAEEAYRAGVARLDELTDKLQQPCQLLSVTDLDSGQEPDLEPKSNFTKEAFEDAVRQCTEYIRAGDIFQVVISRRMELPQICDPFEVYRTLRIVNPSPFMFFVRTPETTLVGASPEVMCRVVDGVTTVRPLAGTRPRGKTAQEDRELAEELLDDPKERAEHVMLVDLGRNDVGRVAEYGSIELSDVMMVERYSHVMHISSNVQGKLKPEMNAMDAMKACLPAGTVSGAPKVRAMEIIDEIEPNKRGPYAGAVGYIDYSGNMDTCIALRTLVFSGEKIYVQAGAGIVADSVPESEYQETINKSGALIKAIAATAARTNSQS
ncbi:MAG: anthranilate synthase component I [Pirellulaceae bacterium]